MKISIVDRKSCKVIREAITNALKSAEEELGMSITLHSGSFTPCNVTFKVEAARISEDGETLSKVAEDFKHNASRYGLVAEDFGKVFSYTDGKKYRIVGAKPKAHKYPILAKNIGTGKIYKFAPGRVKSMLYYPVS